MTTDAQREAQAVRLDRAAAVLEAKLKRWGVTVDPGVLRESAREVVYAFNRRKAETGPRSAEEDKTAAVSGSVSPASQIVTGETDCYCRGVRHRFGARYCSGKQRSLAWLMLRPGEGEGA